MASEGLWVVMGVFSYVLSCMLGKEGAGFYAFLVICTVCIVRRNLFILSFGVIDRQVSMIVTLPEDVFTDM